jgi:uncharacterized protein (TIGR02099 family)
MGGLLAAMVGMWVIAACVLQFWLFPHLDDYRQPLAEAVGKALGLKVEVGQMSGGWAHFHPRFALSDVVVFDSKHQPAVQLSEVKAEIAWLPLLTGNLGFRSLTVETPSLDFRRDAAGHLFLSGLPLDGGGDFRVDALLEQGEVNLRSGKVVWSDGLRRAPALTLNEVSLRLDSSGAQHQLDITLTPPDTLGKPLGVRAEWTGRSFSEWANWQSKITLKTKEIDLAGWSTWVNYPVPIATGKANVDLTVSAQGLNLTQVDGAIAMADLKAQLAPGIKPLQIQRFSSEIDYHRQADGKGQQLKLEGLTYTDAAGKTEPPTDVFVKQVLGFADEKPTQDLTFRVSRVDLARLRGVVESLPIPETLRQQLDKAAPSGLLEKFKAHGLVIGDALAEYSAQGGFKDIAIRSEDGLKFVKGLTGKIDMTHREGKLVLNSENSVLAAPDVLPINQVPLDQLTGQISWKKTVDLIAVKVKGLQLRNADLQAEANGTWSGEMSPAASDMDKAGTIDMKIVFDYAKTESGWKYIPLSASPDISKWVRGAISGGSIYGFRIEMAGRVWEMPYGSPEPGAAPGSSEAVGAPGKFYLGFKTKNLTVKYADGYPPLENLDASFDMNQNQIKIVASKGQINGMKFSAIKADMADVSAYENHLLVSGQAEGPTASAVSFLKDTPLADHIHHFADEMSAEGNGKLDIAVNLNMLNASDVRVQGQYAFVNNKLGVIPNAPTVNAVNGTIRFSEKAIDSNDLQGQWSGEPLAIRIATDDKGASINANGRANVAELRNYYDLPIFDQLSGKTDWQAKVIMKGDRADLSIVSDLKGITSSLPDPFNKSASSLVPLSVSRQAASSAGRKATDAVSEIWRVTLGGAASATLGTNAKGQIVRGKVLLGSGQAQAMAEQPGLQLESLKPVDLDFWVKALGMGTNRQGSVANGRRVPKAPLDLTVKAPLVKAFGRKFQDFKANVQTATDHTIVHMSSRELQGQIDWYPPGSVEGADRGMIQGRLSKLDLTAATEKQPGETTNLKQEIDSLPDLSIKVDELFWQGKPWGRLSFRAHNQKVGQNQSWRIDPFLLEGADLKFNGRLNWVVQANKGGPPVNLTSMDFKLNSPQVGNLLTKLGFPGTVKRGTAAMEGQVSWPATPFGFDPAALSGNFKMTAKDGQFSKMDPGVGRLLGLLSLQSLPQRFSLDFRDIFSEGLAFEAIQGRFDIRDGLMKTSDLEMDTPSAVVLMSGETNLASQTQDVVVTVRPALTNSVALGVTVLNPIAGAVTFAAQKVLGDPLSKVFSFKYHITGTWSDPLVDKESLATDAVKTGKAAADLPGKAVSAIGSAVLPATDATTTQSEVPATTTKAP